LTTAKKSGTGLTRSFGPSSSSFDPIEVTRTTYTGASPGKSLTSDASSRTTPAGAMRASTFSRTSVRSGVASNPVTSIATSFVSPAPFWSMRPLTMTTLS
jgi:large exoprotein involved in heme utilization and adhesion